uniref:Alkylated DNA repair protein AlkB homologue 8 N-terminal domain-containing protein n=1 Tax=Paramormyrops kingsleyae TaxID=1676925 RepID=A0A3B3SQS9_9TELE
GCVAALSSDSYVKFADDTVVLGLISNDDESAYLKEVENLERWCQHNSLQLNVSKTKELIVAYRRQQGSYTPVHINGATVERVSTFRYLLHLQEDLTWSTHTRALVSKARQQLYHLRQLRRFKVSPAVLKAFYSAAVENILTMSITSWLGNCSAQDRKALQRVVRAAERCTRSALASLQDIYTSCCRTRATQISKDPSLPNNSLFCLLNSGKRFHSLMTRTGRSRRSFFFRSNAPKPGQGSVPLGLHCLHSVQFILSKLSVHFSGLLPIELTL